MTPPSLSAPDPAALADTIRRALDYGHKGPPSDGPVEGCPGCDGLAALDALLALAVRAQDSAPGGAMPVEEESSDRVRGSGGPADGAGAEDLAAVRQAVEWLVDPSDVPNTLAALDRLAERLAATEAERDEATAAVYAALHISTEEPSDAAVRFFQRLHDVPEVGGLGAALARAEASEARAEKLEAALRDAEEATQEQALDVAIAANSVYAAQVREHNESQRKARAALDPSPAAEGEA